MEYHIYSSSDHSRHWTNDFICIEGWAIISWYLLGIILLFGPSLIEQQTSVMFTHQMPVLYFLT